MGSLGGAEAVNRKKAMWLYPKLSSAFNPSERWGHSACCLDGVVYVFGGCCGGLHFSDVLSLDLDTMAWSSLATTGDQPGTRDSHSAVLVGPRMVVFGGTNGSKKVSDVHILDLRTKEWHRPCCSGTPPSPRESHTATLVGGDKVVVFGGSGQGGVNYLNDVHVLSLKTLTWSSPEVKGDLPTPRDSHTAVAIGNKLLVYGGDCGDRYHGEVDVLDTESFTWSRLTIQGATPGVRAGHAAVGIGSKVYIIGGVGDKHYYNDVWVLDVTTCSWNQLDVCGQRPQGRFSHTAVYTDNDIAIYGGCGEDERPLNELLILQLGSDHPNGRYNISMCKVFGNHWSQYKQKFIRNSKDQNKESGSDKNDSEVDMEAKRPSSFNNFDNLRLKRRKSRDGKPIEIETEQETSLSPARNYSSQSDQENGNLCRMSPHLADSALSSHRAGPFKLRPLKHPYEREPPAYFVPGCKSEKAVSVESRAGALRNVDAHPVPCDSPVRNKSEQSHRDLQSGRQELQLLAADHKRQARPSVAPLIGAEVHGTVDGAFDSGYLMTANVNGQIFRGVLFAPAPLVVPSPAVFPRIISNVVATMPVQASPLPQAIPIHSRPLQQPPVAFGRPELARPLRQASPSSATKLQPSKLNADLQGVVLTLGAPGGGSC